MDVYTAVEHSHKVLSFSPLFLFSHSS